MHETAVGDWISVDESVPTMPFENADGMYSRSVLALIEGGIMRVCYYHDYRWEMPCGDTRIQVEVVYWMDLPIPPAKEHE